MTSDGVALVVEVDVHVLTESGRVVVSVGLRITERLQYDVTLQQDAGDPVDLRVVNKRVSC